MALSSSEKLGSSGQALELIKQRLRNFSCWEDVDLGDLFEHAHAAAEVLCDDEISKDVFIVLSRVGSQYLTAEEIAKQLKGKKSSGRDLHSVATVFDRTCRNANTLAPGLFVEEPVNLTSGCAANDGPAPSAWKLAPRCSWHKKAPTELLKAQSYDILRSSNGITPQAGLPLQLLTLTCSCALVRLLTQATHSTEYLIDKSVLLAMQELVNMLEETGFEGLQPFGNLKGDIVVLAVQGPKAVLRDGKFALRSEATVTV